MRLLVDGVTKLSKIQFASREEAEAENYRKMIMSMAQDIRVIVIKLADRLHNMRTLSYLGKQKQIQKAKETLDVFAPLAHRLGIHSIKWELEDLAFATLYPRKYAEIEAMVNERRADRERFVAEAGTILRGDLEKVGVEAQISGRAKHFYSIFVKMTRRGKEFNEIYDLTAMRVLVGSDKDCYGAIGVIHALWKPMPGRFKDYIAMPKTNGYQSLHTTVIGPHGKPLEIQVRTQRMHQTAEFGVAAHWLYKDRAAARPDGLAARRRRLRRRQRHRRSSWTACAAASSTRRSTSSRRRASSRRCPPARRRSTSRTPCTPTSATAASAPRSTAASCRCTPRSPAATSSRC